MARETTSNPAAFLREKELWLLVALGVLFFSHPLFLGETFYYRDLNLYSFTQKQLLTDFIAARELPLWDQYLHGGQSYWADINHCPLYPSNLLYVFLPLLTAFNLNIAVHVILCAVCVYLLLRQLQLSPGSSIVGGLVYGFCGYTLSLTNLLHYLHAMPHLPLLLLFWHLFLSRGSRTWFALAIAAGVVRVLAGAPEANVIGMLVLLGWTLVYPYRQRLLRKLILWMLLGLFTIGVASLQTVPTLEMVAHSSRSDGIDYQTFAKWSLQPQRLPELVFPGFLGRTDRLPLETHYWGHALFQEGNPYILSVYFGWAVLILALIGGVHRGGYRQEGHEEGSRAALHRQYRVRLFLLTLFAVLLLLSMGRFLPGFHLLFSHVPFISLFRYPIKMLMLGLFPAALLAGCAAEICFGTVSQRPEEAGRPAVRSVLLLWLLSATLILATALFLVSSSLADQVLALLCGRPGDAVVHQGLARSLLHGSAVALLTTLLFQYRRLQPSRWQQWLLAAIVATDLLSAGRAAVTYAPRTFFTDAPEVVSVVQQQIGSGRLFRPPDPSRVTLQTPSPDIMWLYRWGREVLKLYSGASFRIPLIYHQDFDLMADRHLVRLTDAVLTLPWRRRLPLLSAGAVTLILAADDLAAEAGLPLVAAVPNRSNLPFRLYRNPGAVSRVQLVSSWELVDSDDEALQAMMRPGFDPRRQVVLHRSAATAMEPVPEAPRPEALRPASARQIRQTAASSSSTTFLLSHDRDAWLVFAEPLSAGWRVTTDGAPVPIVRANYAFSAVFMPAGEHRVERFYRPASVIWGVVISVLFCGALVLATCRGWLLGH